MGDQSYSREISIATQPEPVFLALTMHIDQWWTEHSNQAMHTGDPLVVRFEGKTVWSMTVSEAISNRLLVWTVTEANHDTARMTKKDEWKGTTIKWQIIEDGAGSKVRLIHQGLTPELECFDICQAGWNYFLASLKDYLETGKGYPYKSKPDQ